MLATILSLLPSILTLCIGIIGIILVITKTRYAKIVEETGADSEESKKLKSADETLTKVYNMLPGLITFSETMNSGKTGAIKKEFVINYIKNTFAMMDVDLDDASLTAISHAIDDIVTATKILHTGEN